MAPRSLPEGIAHLLAIQARMFAINARVVGMNAENQQRKLIEAAIAYHSGHFNELANELDTLAREADELAPTLHDLQEKL